jgi:hypothetical protein
MPKFRPLHLLYPATVMTGAAALWWFVMPEWPEFAVMDGVLAGSAAGLAVFIWDGSWPG